MSNIKYIIFFLLLSASSLIYAQNGIIRGSVFDALTGESLPGVTIYLEEISNGTTSDLDGKFNL